MVARLHCLSMNEVSCDPLLVSFRLHPLPVHTAVLYTVHSTVLYSWVYSTQADRKLQLVWSGGARVYSDLSCTSFEI